MASNLKRFGATLAVLPLLAIGFVSIASPAYAAGGCGIGEICADKGGNNGGNTGGGGGGGGSSGGNGGGGGGSSGGGGGTVTYDPYAFASRETAKRIVSDCGVRSDGKSALAKDFYYSKKFKVTGNGSPGVNWYYWGQSSGGNQTWARDIKTGEKCLWPSKVYTKTIKCPVSYHAVVKKTKPSTSTLGTASANTGYKAGSRNYATCISANATVKIKQKVTEYGYYEAYTHSRIENVTFEIPYTKNDVTGKIDKPKGLSSSGIITTGQKRVMTGSLDCKNGWRTPGVSLSNIQYTSQLCIDNPKSGFVCVAPTPLIDTHDESNRVSMRNIGTFQQFFRDGKARKMVWGQNIKGNGVKVNSFKTQFTRKGSPWNNAEPINKNSVELSRTAKSPSIWTEPKDAKTIMGTNWLSGKVSTMYLTGVEASNPGGKTTLTQNLTWTGTKKSSSVVITSIDGKTGAVKTNTTTVNVPTSGTCTQSVGIQYIRSIGDVQ